MSTTDQRRELSGTAEKAARLVIRRLRLKDTTKTWLTIAVAVQDALDGAEQAPRDVEGQEAA